MAYFLAALKVLGLIIVCIIGLVLLFAALVLWMPVRYHVSVKNQTAFVYSFHIFWLAGLVSVKKDPFSSQTWLRVLGIPLRCLSGDSQDRNRKQQKKAPGKRPDGGKKESGDHRRGGGQGEKKSEKEAQKQQGRADRAKGGKSSDMKKSFSFDIVSTIIEFIRDTDNKSAFRYVFGEFWDLLCYLGPQKIRGRFVVGTGDPSSTGILIGIISLFPVVYREGVTVRPDFEAEEAVFQADSEMKGRIRVWYLACLALRLYRKKELRKLWDNFNRMRGQLSQG